MSLFIDEKAKVKVHIWDPRELRETSKEDHVINPFLEFVDNLHEDDRQRDWKYVITVCSAQDLKRVFGVEYHEKKKLLEQLTNVKYERKIGSGAYGTVLTAQFPGGTLITHLAVKKVEDLDRFRENELRILAKLKPPVAPKLYGAYYYEDSVYIIMELVQGFSGSKFGKLYGKDMKKCFKLCEELLRHINHLHNKQIGHFDIKPDNLVVSVDDQLKVTLVDYGFAHQLYKDQDLSERFGTPYYCSPQIARAADVNKKSDIWSAMVTVMAIILSDQETGPIPPLKKCYPNYRLSTLQTHLKCEITGPEELIACLPGSVDKHFQDLLSRGLGVKLRHRSGPRKLLKHRAFSKFGENFSALQSFLQEQRFDDGFLSDYAEDNNKEIIGDPLNENCMFNALADQLVEHLSLRTTGQKFREEIVKHLRHNPKKTDGMSLVHFLDDDDPSWRKYKEQKAHIFRKTATKDWHTKQNQLCQIKWRWYLRHMSHSGTQGDALILWAAAQLYEVDIRIIADDGNHFVIHTEAEFPQAELLLGYFQNLRFVSLCDIAVTEVLNADQVPTGEVLLELLTPAIPIFLENAEVLTEVLNADQVPTGEVLLELLTPAIPIFLENAEEMIEVQTETNVHHAEVTEDQTKTNVDQAEVTDDSTKK